MDFLAKPGSKEVSEVFRKEVESTYGSNDGRGVPRGRDGYSEGVPFTRVITQQVTSQAPAEAEEGRACCVGTIKVLAIAFIAAALFAGLIGTLVYTGVIELGLLNCGTMSTNAGLYTLLAGFGSAIVAGIVYKILTCDKCATNELEGIGGNESRATEETESSEEMKKTQTRKDPLSDGEVEGEVDLNPFRSDSGE